MVPRREGTLVGVGGTHKQQSTRASKRAEASQVRVCVRRRRVFVVCSGQGASLLFLHLVMCFPARRCEHLAFPHLALGSRHVIVAAGAEHSQSVSCVVCGARVLIDTYQGLIWFIALRWMHRRKRPDKKDAAKWFYLQIAPGRADAGHHRPKFN